MIKKVLKTVTAAVAALALAFIPATAYAEDKKPAVWLQVSPVANRVTLNPDTELPFTMQVDNIGSEKFKFRVYAAPYSIQNEQYEVNFSKETNRTQVSRWIKFNQNMSAEKDSEKRWVEEATFEVEPGKNQVVEYKISVPKDIPAGGQYATIFAESVPESDAEITGVRTISRVGLIIYGSTTGETVDKAVISDIDLNSFIISGKITSKFDIKNEGNTDFTATAKTEINKIFGGQVAEITNQYPLLPDSPARHVEFEWEDTPVFGIFSVKTTVKALGETKEVSKIVIIMPIFIMIIMLVLLTIIITWLILIVRKRRAQKSRLIV